MTAWLFTFLVHSTLWCGVAWLSLRLFPAARAPVRETAWYMALAASLITPTVHALTSPDSAAWRLPMPSLMAGGEHHSTAEPADGDGAASVGARVREGAHADEASAEPRWASSAGILWLVAAGGLLALYLLRLDELRRRLRDREPVTDPRLLRAMAALGARASLSATPRLTESHDLGSPVALGVGSRREICVPMRARHELDEAEFRALLGHEMAHHMRRDTIRLAILNILQAVFFFQPLFRLATREVRLAAEDLCDDWAAVQLGDRLAMASCLTAVARWVVARDRRVPIPCIGRGRSQLARRVGRMLDDPGSLRTLSRRWWRMGALGLLALAPLLAPGVSDNHERGGTEGASLREHEIPREHGLRERREHRSNRLARTAPPAGEHDSRGTRMPFSTELGPEGTEKE